MSDKKLELLHEAIAAMLEECRTLFKAEQQKEYRLTFVARHTGFPDGSRDVLITDDEVPELVNAIRVLEKKKVVKR